MVEIKPQVVGGKIWINNSSYILILLWIHFLHRIPESNLKITISEITTACKLFFFGNTHEGINQGFVKNFSQIPNSCPFQNLLTLIHIE